MPDDDGDVSDFTPDRVSKHSLSDTSTRTLSQEALDLAEYRVLERVQEKLIGRAKFALALFAAGLTLLGFIGGSALMTSISDSVEKELSAKLDKDAALLNERLRKTLADLNVSAGEIQKVAGDARTKLDSASADIKELSVLSANYSKLNGDVDKLSVKIAKAASTSNEALKDTKDLRSATLNAAAGRPSILGKAFSWRFESAERNDITGSNFGEHPGKVSLRLVGDLDRDRSTVRKVPEGHSEWLPIDAKSITLWSNTKITFSFSKEFFSKVAAAEKQFEEAHKGQSYHDFDYRVETASGLSSDSRDEPEARN